MIETVRQMIVSVTAAAIFSTVMLLLVQKSALHEVIRLATGMLMILALLLPLTRLSLPSFRLDFHSGATARQVAQAQKQNEEITRSSIGGAISRYLEEQANALGIACTVRAEMTQDEQGTLVIDRVRVHCGKLTGAQRAQLADLIEEACGIPPAGQEVTEDETYGKAIANIT